MRLVLDKVDMRHYKLLMEMSKLLNFKVKKTEITEAEEDAALLRAIDARMNDDILSPEEADEFLKSLGT
jgi:hypothetical protein